MNGALFKPDADGWHIERREEPGVLTLIAVRKSPWCGEHLEGLSDRLIGIDPGEDYVSRAIVNLKGEVERHSAGFGCCGTCKRLQGNRGEEETG